MSIDELKRIRIVNGTRTMPAVVITLTGGAAAYCIYKGAEQAAKKIDEKVNKKSVCSNGQKDLMHSLYYSNSTWVHQILESSIGDICISV